MKCWFVDCNRTTDTLGPCDGCVARGTPIDDAPNVVGVDPGIAHCGLAVACGGTIRSWTTLRTHASQSRESRLRQLAKDFSTYLDSWIPWMVAIENFPRSHSDGKTDANASAVHEVIGCLIGVAAVSPAPPLVRVVEPNTLKKTIAGSGRATKDDIRLAVVRRARLAHAGASEHAFDAAAVAMWGEITLRLEGGRRGDR